jgi:hypothetical protein
MNEGARASRQVVAMQTNIAHHVVMYVGCDDVIVSITSRLTAWRYNYFT